MTDKEKDLYLKIGVIAAAYLFVIRPITNKLGITKSAAQEAEEAATAAASAAAIAEKEAALKKKGLKLTKPVAEWNEIANTIEHDIARYSGIDDNDADAGLQLTRVQNDLDVMQLIKSYGKRDDIVFGFSLGKKSLADTIKDNLAASKIAIINGNYARKNIKFRW